LAFAALASGQETRKEIICKDNCERTSARCEAIKVKDFTYTRPLGGFGGIAGNLNKPGTIREISYNSDQRNMTILYNSASGTNTPKNIHLTEEQASRLIDKIDSITCNAPQASSEGNDVIVYTLAYNTQGNNKKSLLHLTNPTYDAQILSTICKIADVCR
jgi:hypothetical protein